MAYFTSPYAFIFHFVKQQWGKFSLLIIAFIAWGFNDALFPYFLKRIINVVATFHGPRAGIYAAISGVLFMVISLWLISELFMRTQGILQIYTFPKMRATIRSTVFSYVMQHSHQYFSMQFSGNLSKKIADLSTSSQSVLEIICFNFVTAFTGAILVLTMMWFVNPLFVWILLAWLIIHFSIIIIFLPRVSRLSAMHSEAVSVLSGKIVDVFSNISNVRLFARHRFESTYLNEFQANEITKSKKAVWAVEVMRIFLGLNGLLLIVGMIFALLHAWVHHLVSIGDFTQLLMQSFWLLGWMWYISFQLSVYSRELGTIENALTLIQIPHEVVDEPNATPLVIQEGRIAFNQVTFHYPKGHAVFDGLNVVIEPGQKIGLVGFSGSGKSTFVNLILRFFNIQGGHIDIDNQNISTVTQHSLRDQIAMIPQDPALFHRSLMENIRYGRLDATDDEVIAAAKLAHCHEFIEKLDDQYNALVGERGIKLSGGQRQRIAIARAILKNAPILILDEATSSLDSVTEKLIQDSLQSLMQNKTTIIIAHRLSTLADMDRILVFNQGVIVEEGTQAVLLRQNGHFAMLWNMQMNGFLPDQLVE